jgi:electron-transferring-flavoprotein dehydrogenase
MEIKVTTLIVGAGPAGLACALRLKILHPGHDVVVIDKEDGPGNHACSGAVLETASLETLLDGCVPGWRDDPVAKEILSRRVDRDDVVFLAGKKHALPMTPVLTAAALLGLSPGQMLHTGNAIVSLSRLTKWMAGCAQEKGVDILYGFAAKEILWDGSANRASGVVLADQGRESDGSKLSSFLPGETVLADTVVLAEGCDGLLTEQLVQKAGLKRGHVQLYSIGVKELIQISPKQYAAFGQGRVVHAMGYPLWTPILGPSLFGGGILYAMNENRLAVGMIVGLDWKYPDFNPQEALQAFKEHAVVNQFIEGGKVVEAGAKMIPEGGYRALPRDKNGNLGCSNVLILGDGAGLVNMVKIKGIHNAVESGSIAAVAIFESRGRPYDSAAAYTRVLEQSNVGKEMRSASKYRQTVAKFGPSVGFPLSIVGGFMPDLAVEEDYRTMKKSSYPFKTKSRFDKMSFVALAGSHHREGQPSHLTILNREVCDKQCRGLFNAPCITFCPAGVYEEINGEVKPANPSNCLHCKTCQRKCPFDNIRWTVPEGGGGPRYKDM